MTTYIHELDDWPKLGRIETLGFHLREESTHHTLTEDVAASFATRIHKFSTTERCGDRSTEKKVTAGV